MDLQCRTVVVRDLPTLVVSGEIDLSTIPVLHSAAVRLVGDAAGRTVAIDLDGVTVLDDPGLGVLLGAAARARELGGDVVVVCSAPRLRRRLELSGLSRAIDVRDRLSP